MKKDCQIIYLKELISIYMLGLKKYKVSIEEIQNFGLYLKQYFTRKGINSLILCDEIHFRLLKKEEMFNFEKNIISPTISPCYIMQDIATHINPDIFTDLLNAPKQYIKYQSKKSKQENLCK